MNPMISYRLEWDEYSEAREFFLRERYLMSPEKVIGGLMITASALWFFLDNLNLNAIIGLVLGLAVIFVTPRLRRLETRRKWKREPFYHSEHLVSFNEEGIHYLMGNVESDLNWLYYRRMLESPDGFLLISGNDSFNLLPKRAFANEEMISNFRNLALKNLNGKEK